MFMSDDERARALDLAEKSVASLRSLTPLRCAIAVPDAHATSERRGSLDLNSFLLRLLGTTVQLDAYAPIFHGETYVTVTAVPTETPAADGRRVHAAFRGVASAMLGIVRGLASGIRARLGISDNLRDHGSWERILFHLAWHFPNHFPTAAAIRFRMSRLGHCREDWLQLWRYNGPLEEPFPYLMFSVMSEPLDLVTATECAVQLIREATGPTPSTPQDWRHRLSELRPRFERFARQARQMGAGNPELSLDAWLVRADSTFATRPAAEWAGIPAPRANHDPLALARSGCVVEWCVIQGCWYGTFVELANLAGALVPQWPERPFPNILADVDRWQQSLPERRAIAGQDQSWFDELGDGSGCPSQPFPTWVRFAVGNAARADRLVTDHRNHIERWVGLVYSVLKLREPDLFHIQVFPEGEGVHSNPWNCVATLSDLNLFEASVRVIDWLTHEPDRHDANGEVEANPPADPSAAGARAVSDLLAQVRAMQQGSAAQIATAIGQPVGRVESFLRRLRDRKPSCYFELEGDGRRATDPRYMYRVPEILSDLEGALSRWRRGEE
jgi:hypothetical protein